MNCCFFADKGPVSDFELGALQYILDNHDESVRMNWQHSRICETHLDGLKLQIEKLKLEAPKKYVLKPPAAVQPLKTDRMSKSAGREPGQEG